MALATAQEASPAIDAKGKSTEKARKKELRSLRPLFDMRAGIPLYRARRC
jgi:hypothetical protein